VPIRITIMATTRTAETEPCLPAGGLCNKQYQRSPCRLFKQGRPNAMSDSATVSYNDETGLFCVTVSSGEARGGLSKAEAYSLADAINRGVLNGAQLADVSARDYLAAGGSRSWDNSTPAGTSAQKG
jgi:hypothetical protein